MNFSMSFAQIHFSSVPLDKQLVGRNLETNMGEILIEGEVNIGNNYYLDFSNWNISEPNDNPSPENAAEIVNSSGKWNDIHENNTQDSYVEYEGLITSLGDLVYLGQYGGHSYFRNPQDLNWHNAKQAAENLGGYLASIHTSEENSAITSFGFFRGWIGLYQDTTDSNYSEPSGGWKWVSPAVYNTTEYTSIKVEVLRNGTLVQTVEQNLNYSNDLASFSFNIDILAELAKYRIKIYSLVGDSSELIRDVDDIVSGDVYIVQGQSNAAAGMYNGSSNNYQNDYIRVFSGGYTSSAGLIDDNNWHYGQGDGNENSSGNTGQWGLVFAKMILDETNIPIAIFNGAHGGQPISFFQRPDNYNSSTNSNYGRLYHRLNKTNLKEFVKGIFWSQGEADSFSNGLTTNEYKNSFQNLISYWQEDYPNVEKYYIFQTRDCDCGTVLSGRSMIKEAQRQLAVENENISIIPTTGMSLHSDNCHFPFVNGYEKFGIRLFKPVMQDFYEESYNEDIYGPLITSCTYDAWNEKLVLHFDTNGSNSGNGLITNTADETSLLNQIKDDFILTDNENEVSIINFSIGGDDENILYLGLSGNPGSAKLSFIGQNEEIEDNITNESGIEIVSFSNICINSTNECNSLDIEIIDDDLYIQIFPNPTKSMLYIKSEKELNIDLYNMVGQKIFQYFSNEINMSKIENGSYLLVIKDIRTQKKSQFKIIKK